MNLPRLILADDVGNPKIVPASIILIQAMKSSGMRLNLFMSSRREEDLRLLEALSGEPVCSVDTWTAGNAKNLKTLFQRRGTPDAVNVLSVPLGQGMEERVLQVYPEPLELAKTLHCDILPLIRASASAAVSTNRALSVLSSLSESGRETARGLLFSSVKNPREFQLLEQEYNRRCPTLSLEYIPQNVERDMPAMSELSPRNMSMKLLQMRSAALQLGNGVRQVEWQIIEALARLNETWPPMEPLKYPASHLNVAVINRDIALEGEENSEAFRALGCSVSPCNPERDPFPATADILYLPHVIADVAAARILENADFRQGLLKSVQGNKLILASGASAVLFGQHYRTASQNNLEGLGLFPFHAHHARKDGELGVRRVEMRGTKDTYFTKMNEKLRGYEIGGFALANPGNLGQSCLAYRSMNAEAETGVSGWSHSYCFVTGLRLDLWSAMDVLYRWISLRKRK